MLRATLTDYLNYCYLYAMEPILDLYSDYLLCSTKQMTATGLSALVDGSLSHDQVTRFLSGKDFDSKELWLEVKPLVRKHESAEACLVFDDTIIEKCYMDESDIICWHWDHSKARNLKGINLLSAFYVSTAKSTEDHLHLPVCYELIKKTIHVNDPKTGKEKRQSPITKNELMKEMIIQQINNQLSFKYILADSWFSSNDNMRFIAKKKKTFIFDMKSNRLCAVTDESRNKGQFTRIDELDIPENTPLKVWLKDLKLPILLVKQVFTNKDQSIGVRFLVSNDLTMSNDQFTSLYKKRWSVEEYHKSIKQNASIASSPAHSVKAQSNHLFAAIFSFVKLERIKLTKKMNHFAIKTKIYMAALRIALRELNQIKQNSISA